MTDKEINNTFDNEIKDARSRALRGAKERGLSGYARDQYISTSVWFFIEGLKAASNKE